MVVSKRAADRRDDILALIRDRNRVYVTELSEKFQVSEVTIRKDLQELEQRGVAKRVHGGAINIYNTGDRKSTRLNSSHDRQSRMPSSA